MPDHDTQPDGPADDPTLNPAAPPPGTEPNGDPEPAPRRGPRFHLASFSVPKFGRKKAGPAAESEAAPTSADGYALGPDPEPNARRPFPSIPWHKLPLAKARRETRVGAAALASFLILVAALLINKGTKGKDDKPDKPSASGTLLVLNGSDDDPKQDDPQPKVDPKPKADPKPKDDPKGPENAPRPSGNTAPPDDPKRPPDDLPEMPVPSSAPDRNREVVIEPAAQPGGGGPPAKPPAGIGVTKPKPSSPSTSATKPAEVATAPPDPLAPPKPAADTAPALPTIPPASSITADDLPSMPGTPSGTIPSPNPAPPIEVPSLFPETLATKDEAKPVEPAVTPPGPRPVVPPPGGGPPPAEPIAGAPPDLSPTPPATRPTPVDPSRPAETPPDPFPMPPPTADPFPAPAGPGGIDAPAPRGPAPKPDATAEPPGPPPHPVVATPAAEPSSLPATGPVPAPVRTVPEFTQAPIEAAPADATAGLPAGGRAVQNLGRKRMPDPDPETRLAPERTVADAPLPREEVGARDQLDPILHTVEAGENFWTISRLYYSSGRYYRALHSANRKLVPQIDELYVGTTIKVPPVESLDPKYIDPPSRSRSTDDAATRTSRSSAPKPGRLVDDGRAVPSRSRGEVARGQPSGARGRADVDEATRPTYRVRPHDTLRSIARDTLGDPHRYREILELNRDAIDDPARLPEGLSLTLPDDAVVRSR